MNGIIERSVKAHTVKEDYYLLVEFENEDFNVKRV